MKWAKKSGTEADNLDRLENPVAAAAPICRTRIPKQQVLWNEIVFGNNLEGIYTEFRE